ncbi:galactose oxidase [Fistulina hepatica ATCC 64428]|uniref:Galactose oxidase n=1 Tax=Fistulina hepatica ATCC 64428 TaxID=1128425 RepID=A0A0D7AHZ0_9AGAR|nr:galactose oxidase [Fistulina hepatica ATCC 64428]
MYWSRAPMWGHLPIRTMRAHSVTLVDSTAWMFGGCDDRESTSKEVYCFDTDTMQWTHPDVTGDIPPPSRAHTATLVDRKIVVFGGGQNSTYFNSVHILDILTRRWTKPVPHNPNAIAPAPRRAHTAVYYRGKIWIFGGGNGMTALNDVWTLDVSVPGKPLRYTVHELGCVAGKPPCGRGYHATVLVDSRLFVFGGYNAYGGNPFDDVYILDLAASAYLPQVTSFTVGALDAE